MIAGIDLGGTQVRVAVATPDGAIVGIAKAATPELGGPGGMVAWSRENAERLAGGTRIEVVGIGVPGPSDPVTGVLVNPPNLAGWPAGLPLGEMLRNEFGAPVHLENDANLAAVGEHNRGAGRGVRNLVYVTWSTGIGSGLILDGKLYSGTHGSAGELGHQVLDPNGPSCFCGMRGCLEAYASGHSIATRAGRPAAEVFRAAEAGDEEAAGIVEQAARMVGLGLLNLTNLVDPEVIVMGGGITESWNLVEGWLGEAILDSPFVTPNRRPRIVRAGLGADVGLVGAVEWAIENR
ncbi:MAG: ROK family protein [Candidatus Dormibacteraeota bacterium]|nr:ROK family protein [Candidatus Dormibacteraeota bacterium]